MAQNHLEKNIMKKKKILKPGKRTVSNLDQSMAAQVKGGRINMEQGLEAFTNGCTDGCSTAMTWYHCTEGGNCTNDCDTRTTTRGALCFTASC
jgi:hypothetical protein